MIEDFSTAILTLNLGFDIWKVNAEIRRLYTPKSRVEIGLKSPLSSLPLPPPFLSLPLPGGPGSAVSSQPGRQTVFGAFWS